MHHESPGIVVLPSRGGLNDRPGSRCLQLPHELSDAEAKNSFWYIRKEMVGSDYTALTCTYKADAAAPVSIYVCGLPATTAAADFHLLSGVESMCHWPNRGTVQINTKKETPIPYPSPLTTPSSVLVVVMWRIIQRIGLYEVLDGIIALSNLTIH